MFDKSKLFAFPFVLVVATFITGCGVNVDTVSGGGIGDDPDSAIQSPGDPSMASVVVPNSLDPAALQATDLGRYPLAIQSMSLGTAERLTGPDGTLLRKLLKYAVGCALAADAQFEFYWADETGTTHPETYVGLRGLAPHWRTQALDVIEQEKVSACLAARTNWYGEAVQISMRGSDAALTVDEEERAFFTKREGAFWGNLFSSTPYLRACYDWPNVLYSRSVHRECAAGHVENDTVHECGMLVITGPCQTTCLTPSADGYYSSCTVHRDDLPFDAQTHHAITVFLH